MTIILHSMKHKNLEVSVTNYGASLADLRLAGYDFPLVLGFPNPEDYAKQHSHIGATAGPYANRIAHGQMRIGPHSYQLDRNEKDRHTLHGGQAGCGTAIWDVIQANDQAISLYLALDDGHMGFPGPVELWCHYRLEADQSVTIHYEALAHKTTFINLAHHSYFRLDDAPDITGHQLWIDAAHYLPVDDDNIPTGVVQEVDKSAFDFRSLRPIGMTSFDHNFCLSQATNLREVAQLYSPKSGISLHLESDQPGLQFYTAHHLQEEAPNHHKRPYHAKDGICLEPQYWPDTPNQPAFPSCLVQAGSRYRQCLRLALQSDAHNHAKQTPQGYDVR